MRYAHTNIVCEDWKRLAGFYQEVFGCVRVPPERHLSGDWLARGTAVADAALHGVHLRLPGHGASGPTLEIFQYERTEGKPPPAANRKGLGHLAFAVDDVEAVRLAVLEAGGGDLGEVVRKTLPGVGELTFLYMTDPEGNILEIQHWGPESVATTTRPEASSPHD